MLLTDLLTQTLKPREIVITDGGSVDSTVAIIEDFIKDGAPVRLVRESNSLPGHARNAAVAQAQSEWVAFIDAGIRPVHEWLESLVQKVLEDETVDVVYGTYEPVTDTFFTECAAIAYVPAPSASDDGLVRPRSIVSSLMRRKVWEFVGGFPEDLRSAEDLIFMRRIQQANCKVVRAAQAIVYWHIQPNLRLTFLRFVEYSRNNIRAGLFSEWQGTIFIYYALIAASTMKVFVFGPWGLLGPPILWMLLMSMRSAKALWRNRRAYPASFVRNIARFGLLVPIIATLDAAAFLGSIKWLLYDRHGAARGGEDGARA